MVRYLNNLDGNTVDSSGISEKNDAGPGQEKCRNARLLLDFLQELAPLGDGVVLLALGWKEKLPEFLDLDRTVDKRAEIGRREISITEKSAGGNQGAWFPFIPLPDSRRDT